MDKVVNNAQKLDVPIAQVATVLGQSTVNPNAPCAQRAKVVGHLLVNPSVPVDLSVVDQLAVCAQGATFVGQQAVNLNPLGAQEQVVNPDAPGVQGATVVGQQTINPDPSGAQGAPVVGQHLVNPDLSGAQGALIVGEHAVNLVNLDATSAQEVTVVGQHAINSNLFGAYGPMIVGQQAPYMPHVPLVYPVVPTTLVLADHVEKPEKFNGSNFTCWQQKMLFYLTTLNLSRFIKEEVPVITASNQRTRIVADAWNNSDYLCRNYVLNCLDDSLYDMYSLKRTSKELWDSLDHNYRIEYAGAKICIVGRFLDYKMVDSKNVISQVQELQAIIHEIHAKGMVISESFQVAAIIEKLPYGWNEFKNRLKYKRKEMSMEDLILRLHIEEDNKRSRKNFNVAAVKENIVEKGHSIKFKKNNTGKVANNVGKGSKMGPKGKRWKTRNFQKKCFNFKKM